MSTFVALYRGNTVSSAQLVAVSAEPSLVAQTVAALLSEDENAHSDSAVAELVAGKRRALRIVEREVTQ